MGVSSLSYEYACLILRDVCAWIVGLGDGWELVHQLDLEDALSLLLETSEDREYTVLLS